jgi:hypothetical protein
MIFMEKNFHQLSQAHKEMLQGFFDQRFDRLRAAINQNYAVLCPIVDEYQGMFHWKSMVLALANSTRKVAISIWTHFTFLQKRSPGFGPL